MNVMKLILRVTAINYFLVVTSTFLYGVYQDSEYTIGILFYIIVLTFPFLFAQASIAVIVYFFIKRIFFIINNLRGIFLTVFSFVFISFIVMLCASLVDLWISGDYFGMDRLSENSKGFLWLLPLAFTSGVAFPLVDHVKEGYSLLSKLRSLIKYD
jgi:hypothetical protein